MSTCEILQKYFYMRNKCNHVKNDENINLLLVSLMNLSDGSRLLYSIMN